MEEKGSYHKLKKCNTCNAFNIDDREKCFKCGETFSSPVKKALTVKLRPKKSNDLLTLEIVLFIIAAVISIYVAITSYIKFGISFSSSALLIGVFCFISIYISGDIILRKTHNFKGLPVVSTILGSIFVFLYLAICLPSINTNLPTARQKACIANIKILENALEMYDMDNPPVEAGVTTLVCPDGSLNQHLNMGMFFKMVVSSIDYRNALSQIRSMHILFTEEVLQLIMSFMFRVEIMGR